MEREKLKRGRWRVKHSYGERETQEREMESETFIWREKLKRDGERNIHKGERQN